MRNIKPTKLCDEEIDQFRIHWSGPYSMLTYDNRVLVGLVINNKPVQCTVDPTESSQVVGNYIDITPILCAALKTDCIDPIEEIHIAGRDTIYITVITGHHVIQVSVTDTRYQSQAKDRVTLEPTVTFVSEYNSRINQTNNGHAVVVFKMADGSIHKATWKGMLKHDCRLTDELGIDNVVQLVFATSHDIAVMTNGEVIVRKPGEKAKSCKLVFQPGTHVIKVIQVRKRLFFLASNGNCWYGRAHDCWSIYTPDGIDVQLLTALSNPAQPDRQPYPITNMYISFESYGPTIFQSSNGEARAVSKKNVHLLTPSSV